MGALALTTSALCTGATAGAGKMRVILLLTTCCLCISQCDSTCFAGDFAACGNDTTVGTSCCLDGNLAAPTQYSIGYTEARCKQGRFQAMSDSDLKAYLTKHTVPVVIGPDGYYITDHHHLIAALLNAKLKSTHHVIARVNYNWSGLSRTDFLKKMVQSNLMWLYNEKGYAPMILIAAWLRRQSMQAGFSMMGLLSVNSNGQTYLEMPIYWMSQETRPNLVL